MKLNVVQVLAASLRGSTLILRFCLMFFLARNLSPEEVGIFGLYWAGLLLASSIIPLDVYAYTTRKLLSSTLFYQKSILSLHLGFILTVIFILSPLAAFLFYNSSVLISSSLLILFLLHLPLMALSQDVSRLLVPLKKPFMSNLLIFIRDASWVLPVLFFFEMEALEKNVISVIYLWLAGSLIAVLFSTYIVFDIYKKAIFPVFSISWIFKALSASGIFFAATILFRLVLGLDKFVVEHYMGIEIVAVYTLFSSVCLGVLGMIETGVSAWCYPQLVKNIQKRDLDQAKSSLFVFVYQNTVATIILMILIVLFFSFAVFYFLPVLYSRNYETFLIISLGVFLYCLSMPYHYVIYGFKKDVFLVIIYAVALCVLFVWSMFFMKYFGTMGAGMMLALSLAAIAIGRFIAASILMKTSFE